MDESQINALIVGVAEEVQGKLDLLYAQGAPTSGSPLDQVGLRDGFDIVDDYLRHGEYGVAFEHLLYMIREPDIHVSLESIAAMKSVATVLGIPDATLGVRTAL